jgi:hypothetical protein
MRQIHALSIVTALLIAAALPSLAQSQQPRPPSPAAAPSGPAPAKPYKPVALTLPVAMKDPSFDALRGQIGDAAKKKDRAALARLVVAKGFFWERESGDRADKRKSGADNLATALGLGNKAGAGWDMLAGYAEDPTASASPAHQGAVCAPADPAFNGKEMEALIAATQTDIPEWGYPVSNGVEVRGGPQSSAPVIDKLGLHFVRVMPDSSPAAAVGAFMRIVTPAGKAGYVAADALAPLGNDQLCYVKEAGGWKIGGYIGGGDAP